MDIVTLEAVQRRFTRLILGMRGLSYQERINSLGLYSLAFRRVRGDLIQTYKILRRLDRVDGEKFSPVGESRTRVHRYKIKGQSFKTEVRRNFLSQRVVNLRNYPFQRVVEVGSLQVFKVEVDKYLIEGYGEMAQKRS